MSKTIYEKIVQFLESEKIPYRSVEHEPTLTSEESARARGEELKHGAKALLLKVDGEFRLFVLSAAHKLDSKTLKNSLGAKECRFATKEELFNLTGLLPGSVPPFGEPILSFPLYIDSSIGGLERVAFNAGSLTHSIVLLGADYIRIARGISTRISI